MHNEVGTCAEILPRNLAFLFTSCYFKPMQFYRRLLFLGAVIFKQFGNSHHCTQFHP